MDTVVGSFRTMLNDRGNELHSKEYRTIVKLELQNKTVILERIEIPDSYLITKFCLYVTIVRTTQETVYKILSILKDVTVLVLMYQEDNDDTAKGLPDKYLSCAFTKEEILRRPLRVSQVPRMRVASASEVKDLESHCIEINKLPRLPMSDFMRRWYGFHEGSVIVCQSCVGRSLRIVVKSF